MNHTIRGLAESRQDWAALRNFWLYADTIPPKFACHMQEAVKPFRLYLPTYISAIQNIGGERLMH